MWMEILTLGSAGACVLALVFASLGVSAATAPIPSPPQASSPLAPPPQQTYEGMVTCSRCGAKHSATIAKNASDCARICVHGGASFALIDGDAVYILDGALDQVTKFAGQRATVTGTATGNRIAVSSVAAGS
jgi:hypothetical protein